MSMTEHAALEAVLDGSQLPHQPLVIITDSAVFSGLQVFKEALRRALSRPSPVVLVSALHRLSSILLPGSFSNLDTIDLTSEISGFSPVAWDDTSKRILEACRPSSQTFIDALDILAEDYTTLQVIRLISTLLARVKPPSRLILLLPHTTTILDTLIPPLFSPALTLLHVVHPKVAEHLSKSYLTPVSSDPRFWTILERARERKVSENLAYRGEEGVEVGDWTSGAVVQVTVRKSTGGVKGITRSLAAVSAMPSISSGSKDRAGLARKDAGLQIGPISAILDPSPFAAPAQDSTAVDRQAQTPGDLHLPFNLSLTDEQKRRRGQVPLPYAHEGEGVELMEFGDDEDEDDEEI